MNKSKKLVLFLLLAAVAFGLFALVRALQMQSLNNSLERQELVQGLLPEPVRFEGEDYLIPPQDIYDAGVTAETMPALDEPAFKGIDAMDAILADEVPGIIIAGQDATNFYSYQIMNWHEVVNTENSGVSIAVTHCALCRSSAVYNRVVDGQELTFEVSGKLYNNNTLLQDRETGSLWIQGTGLAISGELIGTQLKKIPAPVMTWSDYKDAFPNGEALSTDTGFVREYERHPYANYDEISLLFFPLNATSNELSQKWIVNGVSIGDEAIAFSEVVMAGKGAQSETVGGTDIVALFDQNTNTTSVFLNETTEGEVVTITYDFDEEEFTDEETGSTWTSFGLAIDGPLEGQRLDQIAAPDFFWFCWYALHPHTTISEVE